jgi:hypothetical protein
VHRVDPTFPVQPPTDPIVRGGWSSASLPPRQARELAALPSRITPGWLRTVNLASGLAIAAFGFAAIVFAIRG